MIADETVTVTLTRHDAQVAMVTLRAAQMAGHLGRDAGMRIRSAIVSATLAADRARDEIPQ